MRKEVVFAVFPVVSSDLLKCHQVLHLFVNALPLYSLKKKQKVTRCWHLKIEINDTSLWNLSLKWYVLFFLKVYLWFIEGKLFIQTYVCVLIIFFWLLVAYLCWISWPASQPAAITTLPSQWLAIAAWLPIMWRWAGVWILSTSCEW